MRYIRMISESQVFQVVAVNKCFSYFPWRWGDPGREYIDLYYAVYQLLYVTLFSLLDY